MNGFSGRAIRIDADDVSTDIIAPTQWLYEARAQGSMAPLSPHAFEAIRPGLEHLVQPGDILIAGKNFGCGSHRVEAIRVVQSWGVKAILAQSLARLYFRNAIAAGMPALQVDGILDMFDEGDTIEIDTSAWEVRNPASGASQSVSPFPPTVMGILDAGGIPSVVRHRLAETS